MCELITATTESPDILIPEDGQPIPLPVLTGNTPLPESMRQGDPALDTLKRKVLVVDDEPAVADTLRLILEKSGYDARVAYSGEAAIGLLHGFKPDMLVTDVIMPGMTGIQAAIHVCALVPACKVLLISGNESTAALLEAAMRNDREFEILAKPFHPTQLLEKMRAAMSD